MNNALYTGIKFFEEQPIERDYAYPNHDLRHYSICIYPPENLPDAEKSPNENKEDGESGSGDLEWIFDQELSGINSVDRMVLPRLSHITSNKLEKCFVWYSRAEALYSFNSSSPYEISLCERECIFKINYCNKYPDSDKVSNCTEYKESGKNSIRFKEWVMDSFKKEGPMFIDTSSPFLPDIITNPSIQDLVNTLRIFFEFHPSYGQKWSIIAKMGFQLDIPSDKDSSPKNENQRLIVNFRGIGMCPSEFISTNEE